MDELVFITFVTFLSVFVQTSAGFGIALVAMPLLTVTLGLEVAAPLVALTALALKPFIVYHYWSDFSLKDIWQLTVASVVGIVAGSLIYRQVSSSDWVEVALGVVVLAYALYALFMPDYLTFKSGWWVYVVGFASGVLARVYNVGGPPVVIYADGQRWDPITFKTNLQTYGVISLVLVVVTRAANGEFTPDVMTYFLWGIPAMLAGLAAGFFLERYINAMLFRRLVLTMLVFVGLNLMF